MQVVSNAFDSETVAGWPKTCVAGVASGSPPCLMYILPCQLILLPPRWIRIGMIQIPWTGSGLLHWTGFSHSLEQDRTGQGHFRLS